MTSCVREAKALRHGGGGSTCLTKLCEGKESQSYQMEASAL